MNSDKNEEPSKQESILKYVESSSISESLNSPNGKKRKNTEFSFSQPLPKSHKSVDWDYWMNNQKKLFSEVMEKIAGIESKVDTVCTSVDELKNEILLRDVPVNVEEKLEKVILELEVIKSSVEKPGIGTSLSTQAALESTSDTMDTTENVQPSQTAAKPLPENVIPDWQNYLKKRKFGYNKYINNKGRYDLEMEWKMQDTPFIPAEYLPKEMRFGESEREYEVRRKQKLQDFDAHLELLMVRRDDGLAEYLSVDSHVEKSIEEVSGELHVQEHLKAEYTKLISADELECNDKWEKLKTKLLEKPKRETENKIVIKDDRVYAKGRKAKKVLEKPKEQKQTETVKEPEKKPEAKDSNVPKANKPKKKYTAPHWRQHQSYNHHQQMCNIHHVGFGGHQIPCGFPNVTKPPPPLPNAQEPQSHSCPFHWGQPTTRWKHLSPDQQI